MMAAAVTSFNALGSLPDELLIWILDHIEVDDTLTLLALNATSRRFRRLTTSRLYSKFHGLAPELFLRTIALSHPDARPELAEHVKEVVWNLSERATAERRRCLPLEDRLLLENKLRNSGCLIDPDQFPMDPNEPLIDFHYQHEGHWWCLEFFLFFTPKVQRLIVGNAWQWDYHVYFFWMISMNPHHFAKLSSVTLHGPLQLESVVPLLTLPSIRKLELVRAITTRAEVFATFEWEHNDGNSITDKLSGGSSLEKLTLRESNIFFPNAIIILERLNKLKSLTYEHVDDDSLVHHTLTDAFPIMREVQRLSKCPLEHLRIRSDTKLSGNTVLSLFATLVPTPEKHPLQNLRIMDIGPCHGSSFMESSLGSLYSSETLNRRDIIEQLPDTLEVLHFKWDYTILYDGYGIHELFHYMKPFAKALASSSNLKRIVFVDWPALKGWIPQEDFWIEIEERFSSLPKLFQELGMELTVVCEEIDGEEPLVTFDDHEFRGWLWVHKTDSFDKYASQC